MNPFMRCFKVLVSPGEAFEDLRRDPKGWWAPIAVITVLAGILVIAYVARYDLALVLQEQLKDHWSMKLAASMGGPEARDKALDAAVSQVSATPRWQMQVSQVGQMLVGVTGVVWFFTFLYGLMALMMGWLPGTPASRLFANLGIVAAIGVVGIAISAGMQISRAVASRGGGGAEGAEGGGGVEVAAPPAWLALATALVMIAVAAGILWACSRLLRDPSLGSILGAVSYGMMPVAVGAIVGLVIVMVRTPDATAFEEIVPANLTLLLNLKASNAILASLGSAIGVFSLWSIALTIVGLAKGLGRSTGQAAAIVLVPWGAWVLLKTAFAAVMG